MRWGTVVLLAVGCSLASMYMAGQQESQSLPDVTFRTYQSESVRTGDMKGNILFVQLWATTCKSCRAMRAAAERLNGKFAAQGVMFLSVNEDAQQKTWENSLIRKPSPLIEVRDEKHSFRRRMHVASLPVALIVDRSGHVRWRGSWTSTSEMKASEALARLLQEH